MTKLFRAMLVLGVLAVPALASAGHHPTSGDTACDCGDECKCGDGCKCKDK
jgi:hypothetical protein